MAKKAQKKIRTLALEFEARLKRFPPHERGLLWWSAATTVQSTLVFLTNKKRYPAEYFCRYIAVLAASTKVAFAVNDTARLFMKPVIEARLIFQKASEMSSSNGVDLPSLPWTQSFDLPWFPEVEKRLGRIVGRFNLFGGFSVIKVADARDPDLVHFVTTGMSAKFFGDTPAEDHEFFITITKKGSDSAKACPKVLKPAMIEYAPATELEYSAIQILYAVYHMYRSKLKSEFQRKFIMMYRAETDGAPAAERFTRSTKLAPIASDLPYKAVTTCDTDRDRRIAPFAYGDGRTMTLTACVPLYAEELQYAIDHSAQALFERFGLEAFTPMRQTRENLGAGIVES